MLDTVTPVKKNGTCWILLDLYGRTGHVGYCYTCREERDMLDTVTPVKKNGTCWILLHL